MKSLNDEFVHGTNDCVQDDLENAPFGSVGGLEKRHQMVAPEYVIGEAHKMHYLSGYALQASSLYGKDWKTCTFGWEPALTIDNDK